MMENSCAGWVRLERGNDWGKEFLMLPGGNRGDKSDAIQFMEGERIEVRWPDGSVTTEVVVIQQFYTTVSDHGHEYPVQYEIAGVRVVDRGLSCWVPLDQVEIRDMRSAAE